MAKSCPCIVNRANGMTFFRLMLLLASMHYSRYDFWTFLYLYVSSVVLDMTDGMISRYYGESTIVGATFDAVLDRMSTCYLILVIVRRYPDLVNWLFGVLAIDVAGHWVHNYACALIEKENHKNVPDATFVLRIYYQKKIVMFLSIVGYETFLCSLYGRSFYKAYTPMYELGTTLMIVSSPLAFFKVLTNVLQGLYGLQKINKFERMRYEGPKAKNAERK